MTIRYVTSGHVDEIQRRLTPTDRALLDVLDRVGYASTKQLERAVLPDVSGPARARRIRRRLHLLHAAQAVHRVDRSVGGYGGGSAQSIYTLDRAGHRLVHPDDQRQGTRRRPQQRGLGFLAHTLAVTEHLVGLIEYAQRHPGTELVEWVGEPDCHVPFFDRGRLSKLTPDALSQIRNPDTEVWTMLEVDRGTEAVRTLLDKATDYLTYAARHPEAPQVVWSLTTPQRAVMFTAAINRSFRQPAIAALLDRGLFVITTSDHAAAALCGEAS